MTTAIYHLVLLKFRSDVEAGQIDSFILGVKSLRNIDGVIWADAGRQNIMYPGYANRAAGYNYMVMK